MGDRAASMPKTPSDPHRLPPQNLEAEQCVLGSVLLQQGALVKILELVAPSDFYREAHKNIFSAMVSLFEKNEPQDIITVSNILKDKNFLLNLFNKIKRFLIRSIVGNDNFK